MKTIATVDNYADIKAAGYKFYGAGDLFCVNYFVDIPFGQTIYNYPFTEIANGKNKIVLSKNFDVQLETEKGHLICYLAKVT